MSDIIALIKTYACPNCPYRQYFDPFDAEQMARTFPEPVFVGLALGNCPACHSGQNPQRVRQSCALEVVTGSDLSLLGQHIVASDESLMATTKIDTDADGEAILEQTGTREEIGIVNGDLGIITVPVYEPKMRSLTTQELAELKLQRDQNLNQLESIAVKEV